MMKNIAVRICDRNDKPKVYNLLVDEKDEEIAIESLSHDLEQGSYVDEVFY